MWFVGGGIGERETAGEPKSENVAALSISRPCISHVMEIRKEDERGKRLPKTEKEEYAANRAASPSPRNLSLFQQHWQESFDFFALCIFVS